MSIFAKRADELVSTAGEKVSALAAGTLVLSITFRTSIAPEHPQMVGFLITAWIALTVSLVAYVIGLLCQAWVWLSVEEKTTTLSTKHKLLFILPVVFTWGSFGAGLTFFTLFALMNVKT